MYNTILIPLKLNWSAAHEVTGNRIVTPLWCFRCANL